MARRIRVYLFGFIIGIILVIFLYGDKYDIIVGWMPEKRVLKRLKLTEKVISDSMQCVLDCNNFNENDWKLLYANGDVNFAEARKKPYPIYSVNITTDNDIYNLKFLAKDTLSVLIGFNSQINHDCNCD
jgi:hypothetical protein